MSVKVYELDGETFKENGVLIGMVKISSLCDDWSGDPDLETAEIKLNSGKTIYGFECYWEEVKENSMEKTVMHFDLMIHKKDDTKFQEKDDEEFFEKIVELGESLGYVMGGTLCLRTEKEMCDFIDKGQRH